MLNKRHLIAVGLAAILGFGAAPAFAGGHVTFKFGHGVF